MLTRSKAKALKLAEAEEVETVKTADDLPSDKTTTRAKKEKDNIASRASQTRTGSRKTKVSTSKRKSTVKGPKPAATEPEQSIPPSSSLGPSFSLDRQGNEAEAISNLEEEESQKCSTEEDDNTKENESLKEHLDEEEQPFVRLTTHASLSDKTTHKSEYSREADKLASTVTVSTTPNKNIEVDISQRVKEINKSVTNDCDNEVILKRRRESGGETPTQVRLTKRPRYDDEFGKVPASNRTPERQIQSSQAGSHGKGDESPTRHAKRCAIGDVIGSPSPMRKSSSLFATRASFASPGLSASSRKSVVDHGVIYTPISKYAQSTFRPDTVPAPKHSWFPKTNYETPIKHTIPRPFVFATAARAEEKKKRMSMSPDKSSPLKAAAQGHLNALRRLEGKQAVEDDTLKQNDRCQSTVTEEPEKSCQSPLFDVENIRNDAAPYFEQSVAYLKRIAAEKGINAVRDWESRRQAKGNTTQ